MRDVWSCFYFFAAPAILAENSSAFASPRLLPFSTLPLFFSRPSQLFPANPSSLFRTFPHCLPLLSAPPWFSSRIINDTNVMETLGKQETFLQDPSNQWHGIEGGVCIPILGVFKILEVLHAVLPGIFFRRLLVAWRASFELEYSDALEKKVAVFNRPVFDKSLEI